MIFGLFENKQGRAFREETANTIADADSLEKKDKKKIAKFVLLKIKMPFSYRSFSRRR